MLVRAGKLVFESPAQQHSFNFPYQIGSKGDPVGSAQVCLSLPGSPETATGAAGGLHEVWHVAPAPSLDRSHCEGCRATLR